MRYRPGSDNILDYKLPESEAKFADLIWQHEPVSSGELVKLCEKKMNCIEGTRRKANYSKYNK